MPFTISLLLFLLRKVNKFEGIESYINSLYNLQKDNGSLTNGYSSFLISKSNELDVLHSAVALINFMEYKIYKTILD